LNCSISLRTALRIAAYPVHLHKFPSMARSAPARSNSLGSANHEVKAMMNPGVQNPHWLAFSSRNARITGVRPPEVPSIRPSRVIRCLPLSSPRASKHEGTARYRSWPAAYSPINTAHAPQSPSRQPSFVAISPSSPRIMSIAGVPSSERISCHVLLTFIRKQAILLYLFKNYTIDF